MRINKTEWTVKEVTEGYNDLKQNGCFSMNDQLNIRPIYQREFVYDDNKQKAVINSILNGLPLNVMYWVKQKDGKYNVLDGQQRTISIAKYINGEFSVDVDGNPQMFHNLSQELQDKILDYKLDIYICEGSEDETLSWFERTVNQTRT